MTTEYFNADAAHDPPFHPHCKECRNAERSGKKALIRDKRFATTRQTLVLEALGAAIRNPQAPHTAELVERIYAQFGGLEGFVEQFYSHFLMTEIGGPQRTKMLDTVIRLTAQNVSLGGAKKPLDYYSEEELEHELAERVETVAMRLIDAAPENVVDGQILDAAGHVECSETG